MLLYKHRLTVEPFFEWVKQHPRVLSFWGTCQNAVKTQVYIAIITFMLVSIVEDHLKTVLSLNDILQVLSVYLLDKTPLGILVRDYVEIENALNVQFSLEIAENTKDTTGNSWQL